MVGGLCVWALSFFLVVVRPAFGMRACWMGRRKVERLARASVGSVQRDRSVRVDARPVVLGAGALSESVNHMARSPLHSVGSGTVGLRVVSWVDVDYR
jgi:hypothetical protein